MLQLVGILYFVSATVNPILYNIMSVRYRKAFHNTLHAALTAARCQRPDAAASLEMANRLPSGLSRPLLRGHHSDSHLSNLQIDNRRMVRSTECINQWTMSPNSQTGATTSRQSTTVPVSHTLSDQGPRTSHCSRQCPIIGLKRAPI